MGMSNGFRDDASHKIIIVSLKDIFLRFIFRGEFYIHIFRTATFIRRAHVSQMSQNHSGALSH